MSVACALGYDYRLLILVLIREPCEALDPVFCFTAEVILDVKLTGQAWQLTQLPPMMGGLEAARLRNS